ncbi:MAG: flagellar export chaperone FlgN [Lachnospiraceae bacterium]|nr:flagellar export chaperone FlgN [Lachnospiraceae bacterium]
MIENYLEILEESLKKKIVVLDEIEDYTTKQESLLRQENVSMEELDANMEQKDELIQKLTDLDEGFETLYERVKEQLSANRDAYKDQIKRLQALITKVTEKSVSVQAKESRNKKLVEDYFTRKKSEIRQGRQASKTVLNYYKSMSDSSAISSQIMDQKK